METDPRSPLLPLQNSSPRRPPSPSPAPESCFRSVLPSPNTVYILLGPVLCAVLWAAAAGRLAGAARSMLAVLGWVFAWWVTEAVPMAVTSLAPLFLFPLFGIAAADAVARCYMDDVISLVLGSFILALAVQHYGIHRRLALNVTMLFCGDPPSPALLLLGICATTAFVSMWMHNTAAAVLMMPVATGILQRLPSGADRTAAVEGFCRAVVLGVMYAVVIGGMSTLTGTGVNLIVVGLWKSYAPKVGPITFSQWLLFGLPLALLMLAALWAILCCLYVSRDSAPVLSAHLGRAHLRRELEVLGPMGFAEKMVLAVFSILIVLWMTRSFTHEVPGWGRLFEGRVGDGTVSVLMATVLFVIPNRKAEGEKLMDWKKCEKLPWNIVLLLGAGLAIAEGVRSSGLAEVLSGALGFLEGVPRWAVPPAVCLAGSLLTELITSNNAATLLLTPILYQIATAMRLHPLLLMLPGAFGAQLALMLPTATPSNSIGFATGCVEIRDMVKAGAVLKIVGILAVSVLMPTLGAYVFGTGRRPGGTAPAIG